MASVKTKKKVIHGTKYAVHKYPIDQSMVDGDGYFTLNLTENYIVLSVDSQHGILTLWVMEETTNDTVKRHAVKFRVLMTGQDVSERFFTEVRFDDVDHIGTVLLLNDSFVLHVFICG